MSGTRSSPELPRLADEIILDPGLDRVDTVGPQTWPEAPSRSMAIHAPAPHPGWTPLLLQKYNLDVSTISPTETAASTPPPPTPQSVLDKAQENLTDKLLEPNFRSRLLLGSGPPGGSQSTSHELPSLTLKLPPRLSNFLVTTSQGLYNLDDLEVYFTGK